MRKIIIFAVALMLCEPLFAQELERNIIQVTGFASREITPDEFTLDIELSESDSKGRRTLQQQEREMIAALKGVDIDTNKDLRLADNSSDYFRRGVSVATRRYKLTLHSNYELTAAFDALRPLGLSSVTLTKAICTQLEEIRAELRREAILNARAKANEIATAIDQSIGSCIYVLDYNSGGDMNFSPRNYANRAKGYSSADFAAESEVFVPEFTKERVEYSLQAKFELHPQKVQ